VKNRPLFGSIALDGAALLDVTTIVTFREGVAFQHTTRGDRETASDRICDCRQWS
jgi:hypothetical protein